MEQLAIIGHATRGKEVIEILEMLGGKNPTKLKGNSIGRVYIINSSYYGKIDCLDEVTGGYNIFTLEEFLDKFPYKVGDKVSYIRGIGEIVSMHWNPVSSKIVYDTKVGEKTWQAISEFLLPYKEQETMEEIKQAEIVQRIRPEFGKDKVEIVTDEDCEIVMENGRCFVIKKQPQYPKTYEECCKAIDINYTEGVDYVIGYKREIIQAFQQLLICRDAYWKIAGDWKPEWNDEVEKYSIEYNEGELRPNETTTYLSRILSFPIKEMRDAFYENFKALIEKVKELL